MKAKWSKSVAVAHGVYITDGSKVASCPQSFHSINHAEDDAKDVWNSIKLVTASLRNAFIKLFITY